MIPTTVYPEPIEVQGIFTCKDICRAVQKLKPYKVPRLNGIPNIVLQMCINSIINHLFYIFQAILKLDMYPSRWLSILMIVLRKPGKATYNIAKVYRPIGLLKMISKLFLTLIAVDLFYITEKHGLLPPTQFGGRPGRCTTNTRHLVVTKVKDAWRVGKVTSVLFLDIQVTLTNTVKAHLLHNMKSRHVPTQYIQLFDKMLTGCKTWLHFDDYISEPILIMNGTMQGCPLLMLLYAYYNVNLINIAKGKCELSTGFVDDCAFVAVADTLDKAHAILKDMMEHTGGGLDWSHNHNSPFELSKLAVMDFARTPHDLAVSHLQIDKHNSNGTITSHTVPPTDAYKYLSIVFDPKLTWRAHITKVVANVSHWSRQLGRLSRVSSGLSPSKLHQLYITVTVPAFMYTPNVWYILPFKFTHSHNT